MVRKTPEEIAQKHRRKTAEGALTAFLGGEKTINWVVGSIRYSDVRDQELAKLFEKWEDYGNKARYQEAHTACREQGWMK